MKNTYRTIDIESEYLLKEKQSKFYGYAFPVSNTEKIKFYIQSLQKKHNSARHFCYAYQLGIQKIRFRANDDGEPKNSAGLPIYGQIQSFEVTNILIVSVRYFGGTKLGVGGLISAYKTSAQITLEASVVVEKTINIHYKLTFNYDLMNAVQRIIKEKQIDIIEQKLEMNCQYTISIRKKDSNSIFTIFNNLYKVDIKVLD